MKAATRSTYGTPDVLTIKDVEKPSPRENEVLVKVYATTVNRSDYHVLTGEPPVMRLVAGFTKPKLSITGSDFTGQVEAIGKNVTMFKPGDNVMGFIDLGSQSHAEYLAIPETKAIRTPTNLKYHEAVACLEGAFYALCGVQWSKAAPKQTAFVIGATGAIGSSYVQFLKASDIEVTATCEGKHTELVRSLGASRVIDYKAEDFTQCSDRFDHVFDAVGKYTFNVCKHLLKPKGVYTSSRPNVLRSLYTPLLGGKREVFAIPKNLMANLGTIRDLIEQGKFRPVIDREYSLEQIADAYRFVAKGEKIGNVIIRIA